MKILSVPYNLGAPERNPKTISFPVDLERHVAQFPFRTLSEDGREHSLKFLFPADAYGKSQTDMLASQMLQFNAALKEERACCIIGGDNSICYFFASECARIAETKGIAQDHLFLMSFDRHPDMMPPSPQKAHHATWLRQLIDEERFHPRNVYAIGIGDAEPEELRYMKEKNIQWRGISDTRDICPWGEAFIPNGALFVSLDVDILDPSVLPGTGTPRGGGMSVRELLWCIKYVRRRYDRFLQVWCITEAFDDPGIDPARLTLHTVESLVREIAVENTSDCVG